jgi:hypothetical protein
VALVTAAAVVFVVVCVLVGESVSTPTHARAQSDAASELPSTGSPIGMIAVLMAVTLSLLATVVVIRMLARSTAPEEDLPRECTEDGVLD